MLPEWYYRPQPRRLAWGSTRIVVLTRRWAIKLPRPTEWRLFLHGLLANMQERQWSSLHDPRLCPVKWSLPGGWLVVMPRAEPISDDAWAVMNPEAWCGEREEDEMPYCIPVEAKRDSFGRLPNGRIVAVDYGT